MRPSASGRVPGRTTSNILQAYRRLSNRGAPWRAAIENLTKPPDAIADLRALAHELSNSLETVLQAAYLLQGNELDGKDKKWAQAIDSAAREAARINREIRKILDSQS